MTARLNAVREYGLKLPAANGKSATVGYCFGGSQSFAYAVSQPGLNAAVVPVLGLYGGADARIGATIPATEATMKELGKTYEPHTFENAGHGFLRAQTAQNGANMKATEQAWPMTVAFIRKHTEGR